MKYKAMIATVMGLLGISAFEEKEGKRVLTEEQRAKLSAELGDDMLAKIEAALSSESESNQHSDSTTQTETQTASLGTLQVGLAAAQDELEEMTASNSTLKADLDAKKTEITRLQQQIEVLSGRAENLPPVATRGNEQMEKKWDSNNNKFLGGVEYAWNKIDAQHPFNQRAYAAIQHAKGNYEVFAPEASSTDYTSLKAELGDFYRVRKQDQLISWTKSLPTLEKYFKLESGLVDEAELVGTRIIGELSQASNISSDFAKVVKGKFDFPTQKVKNYPVMFAHMFESMDEIERTWIAYVVENDGSDAIKWSLIEYLQVEATKALFNERERRRIRGKRIEPTKDVPGTAMGASDGIVTMLKKAVANYQINPFQLGEWDNTNAVEYIQNATKLIPQVYRDMGNLTWYVSTEFKTAYNQNRRSRFGVHKDFVENIDYVMDYENVSITVIPNLAPSKLIFCTIPGNIIFTENKPNEMVKFYFEQVDWKLKVWSRWKEGTNAYVIGIKQTSALDFPEDYSSQLIWMNDVDLSVNNYIAMNPDEATPSVADHKSLISVTNTSLVTITNILDAATGDEIRIKAGTSNNGIKIAKSGNFNLITADWVPSKGDIIHLKKRSDGKFIEIQRINAVSDAIAIAADDTTPDVTGGSIFVTNANTQATAITTFDNAIPGKTYTIYGAGSTNASTIANSGNFVLTAAITLSTGKFIKLVYSSDGKFYEIERL